MPPRPRTRRSHLKPSSASSFVVLVLHDTSPGRRASWDSALVFGLLVTRAGMLLGLESEDPLGVATHDQFQLIGRKAGSTEVVETVFRVEVGKVAAEQDTFRA